MPQVQMVNEPIFREVLEKLSKGAVCETKHQVVSDRRDCSITNLYQEATIFSSRFLEIKTEMFFFGTKFIILKTIKT